METIRTENKMGTMPIGKLLANMAIPMMISMLAQAFYNVVDSVYVSQLNENALSAISLAFPLQNLMIAFASGTAVGINALLSRSLGAKQQEQVDWAANTSVFLVFCNAILFSLIGIFASRLFFSAQTTDAQIIEYGTSYTSICLGASIAVFGQFSFERLLQSTGRTNLAMCTQLVGALINIIFDPIFIFGYFGFPRMEVAGAAAATVLGQLIAALLALYFNLRHNPDIHLQLKKLRFHWATIREVYRVGIPSIIMMSIGSVMNFGLNQILITFSTTATAVFGVYFKLQSFIFMPIFGLNNGMVPIISYNYGAKNPARVKKTIKLAICCAICLMLIGLCLFELIPGTLLNLFNATDNMRSMGIPAFRIIALHFIFAGFCIVSSSVFQAIGNPVHALINSICRQLMVLLPAAWLLAQTGKLELVWFCFPIAEIFSFCLNVIFLRKTLRHANAQMQCADTSA